MPTPALHLPPVIAGEDFPEATRLLTRYYGSGEFIGGRWDAFDPSGTRTADADRFTGDDVASTALLNTPLDGSAVEQLLLTRRDEFTELLQAAGPDRDFIEVDPDPQGGDMKPVFALYEALKTLPDVGPTIASKLLARKRPNLFAIVDSVLLDAVFRQTRTDTHIGRQLLHEELAAEGRAVWQRLLAYREAAGLGDEVSALRVFDVLAWMTAKGY
ncbi:DUF6308 family protein [Micrococcus sp.]|uniref:DUF6308 family protein n=1 Tax=Micrococcus sp. TaxID=1271 RepID=UPI0026DCF551|nr:DUF6308 family protein [Micrococcus sp.]MDO4239556.1 DUF6308 family protein [Micrococcus sp.]